MRGRRRLTLRVLAATASFMLVLAAAAAVLGVHDEGFQLEGNATAADLSFTDIDDTNPGNPVNTVLTPGTLGGAYAGAFDWSSLFDVTGTGGTASVKGALPGDFSDADFVSDFKYSGTTFITSDDTTFTTGSKDTLPISTGWECAQSNNVNSKTDIANGYAALLEPPGGDRTLYFGLEKDVDNGTNNVGIWLFQSSVSCSSTGKAVPFSGDHVPGDLFLVSAFTNGGGVANITAYQWTDDLNGDGTANDPGLDPNPVAVAADCLDGGPSGTDNTEDRLCAVVNGKTITMPWRTVDGGVINAPKVSPNFFEGGINLDAFDEFADTCFTGFMLTTRSSQSLTATLFDYVLGDIDTCNPELSIEKTPDSGSYFVGDSLDWTLEVANTGDGDASDAAVEDTIPDGLTITGTPTVDPAAAGSCTYSGQDVDCTLDVAAGGSVTITVPVESDLSVFGTSEDGCVTVTNTGTVSIDGDSDPSDDSDTGQVDICRPSISKTAAGTYDERHEWTVDKSVDPASQSAFAGETVSFDWTITVDETVSEENFGVTGTITIANPNPEDALTIGDLADVLDDTTAATITSCTGDADLTDGLTVAAGGSTVCDYTASPTGRDATSNTASFTLNEIPFSASDAVEWTANVIRGTATLDDDQHPYSDEPVDDGWSDTYADSYTCSSDLADYTDGAMLGNEVSNTAEVYADGALQDDDTATTTIDCYALSVDKTASTSYDRDFDWTITKDVDPGTASLFDGQTAGFEYTIVATKSAPIDTNFAVSGTIVISNPAGMDATLTSVSDSVSGIADPLTVSCPSMTVPANDSLTCTYASALPDKDARTNTATAVAYGVSYSDTAGVTFGDPTNVTDDSDSVDDTIGDGDFGPVSATTTHTYTETYDCSGVTYTDGVGTKTIPNTATLVDDGDSDDASVTLTCYALSVDKTAATTYDRDFDWTITKSVDQSDVNLAAGGTTDVTYTVVATKGAAEDGNFAASGTITITNPAPMPASITSITDSLTGVGELAVDCGGATSVPADGSLVCSYSTALADGSSRTNSVDVVAYGVTYSDTADVTFGDPANVTDDCATVTDSLAGTLGTTCASNTYTYDWTVGPYATCGDYTVDNTATVTAEDSGDTDSDSQAVDVHVTGCGNLFHTGTTCEQYYLGAPPIGLSGTGIDVVEYSVKSHKVSQVNPGVFFYYTTVTGNGGTVTALIDQAYPTPPGAIGVQNVNQVRVYDASCNTYSNFTFTTSDNGGDVNLLINGTTGGADYIVSVKYDPTTLVGRTAPSSTVTYSWATVVGGNTSGVDTLDLVAKKKK